MTISSETKRIQYTTNVGVRTHAITFPYQVDDDITVVLREVSGNEITLTNPANYTISAGNVVVDPAFTPWATGNYLSIILDPPLTQGASLPNSGSFPSSSVEDALDKLLNLAKRTRDIAERSLRYTDGSVVGTNSNYDAAGVRLENVGAPVEDNDAATKSSVAAQLAAAILTPSIVVSAAAATVLDDLSTDAMLTTLGGGAKGISVFKKATSADVLTDLGVSAFVQSIVDEPDGDAFLAAIDAASQDELSEPNLLVNGDMQVWQMGPTFNSTTPVAGGNNDGSYFADQWILLSNGANVVNAVKYLTPSEGARGAVEFTVQAADTKWGFMQIIESQKVIPLRSQKVSLSVQLQTTGSLAGMKLYLLSWNSPGAADAPTLDPISAWNAAQADPTLVANWVIVGSAVASVFPVFSAFKLENITVPATANNLAFLLTTWDTSFSIGATMRATAMAVISGERARKFVSRPLASEIQECERWYQKTFALETYPASNVGLPGALQTWLKTMPSGAGNPRGECMWQFRTRMRATPHTVSPYNPFAANTDWGDGAGNVLAPTFSGAGETGVMVETAQGAAAGTTGRYALHASASARFV